MKRSVHVCAATALTLLSAISFDVWAESQGPDPAVGVSVPPTVQASAPPALQPSIATTLSANTEAASFNPGGLGPIYVTGVASGLAQVQSKALPSDRSRQLDIGNAQVFINKPDGLLQFFLQGGYYSIPMLGAPYIRSADATPTFFGPVAQGFLKIAPTENFSVLVGKLPTLIGAESTFSFQNMNIQRGLLWNQENAVNRGAQVNYAAGPLTLAASVNDGFYSNQYSWVSMLTSYAFDSANTLAVIAGGNTSRTNVSTTATPLFYSNQQIYNLIYTHTEGPWTFQPYLQYTRVPKLVQFGAYESASTYGGALLMSYDFGAEAVPAALRAVGFKLPVRLEYIGSTGSATGGAPNLLYGPGSAAWSFTVTPTYQYKRVFARAEFSYVGARKTAPGLAFGTDGNNRSQVRGLLEVGLLL